MAADHQVAVVTGASRGIGRAIALALAGDGYDIIAVGRNRSDLLSLQTHIERQGRRLMAISADLALPESPNAVADQAYAWRGAVSILVNAAGLLIRKAEADIDVTDWDRTLALNARAPFFLTQNLGTRMRDAGGGVVINVASIAGEIVTGAPAPYQASKAALIQLTRFFANRLAPQVRVNAIGPGYVRTELSGNWLADPANTRWAESHTPLGRIAVPDDIAGAVAFLASERAAYITGQHLLIDGGWSVS